MKIFVSDGNKKKVESGFSPLGSDKVEECPDGTYAPIDGLEYPWQCYTCPPGYYCTNGNKTLCEQVLHVYDIYSIFREKYLGKITWKHGYHLGNLTDG